MVGICLLEWEPSDNTVAVTEYNHRYIYKEKILKHVSIYIAAVRQSQSSSACQLFLR